MFVFSWNVRPSVFAEEEMLIRRTHDASMSVNQFGLSLFQCGFFKRNRPKYPSSARDDEPLQDPYRLSSNQPAGGLPHPADSDELSSENNDDPEMMIDHPIDSLPIIVPQHSSHFIQQQQQRTQLPYWIFLSGLLTVSISWQQEGVALWWVSILFFFAQQPIINNTCHRCSIPFRRL